MNTNSLKKVEEKLRKLYSKDETQQLTKELEKLVSSFRDRSIKCEITENDVVLICYANSIIDPANKLSPLQALSSFLKRYDIPTATPTVHLLPFYPWDTDRGFSVKDYYKVDPNCGNWDDIKELNEQVKLAFDFVANHASIENPLVQGGLISRHLSKDHPEHDKFSIYKNFVIAFSEEDQPSSSELEKLARPRANPVLTPYLVYLDSQNQPHAILGGESPGEKIGAGLVWTTFSRGQDSEGREETRQVDLNFKNPAVFLESLKILLFYAEKGANFIRLDAIGYLWKKLGQTSLHEKETHLLIECFSDILTIAAPNVLTIAEVNEPQEKVLPYLGSKENKEADLIYQFSHFPLAVHAVHTGLASHYVEWLKTTGPANGKQFITLLGSHDGMGMKPARGILSEEEIDSFVGTLVDKHGAKPNYAILPGNKKIVYEACSTPWGLINNPNSNDDFAKKLARYLAVCNLGFLVKGIPGIYINGLLGARNYAPPEGLDENRTVNREIFDSNELFSKLDDKDNELSRTLDALCSLLKKRAAEPAFSPLAGMPRVVESGNAHVATVYLPAEDSGDDLLIVINIDSVVQEVKLNIGELLGDSVVDVVLGVRLSDLENISLEPYQVVWLKRCD